ncbi:hypothetical protein COK15_15140 [Bacillus cereus]|uniref:AbiTii domain-containing protein n=1 Tax=Bacillus cereus TaxID=1396 RepID=UPI000BF573D0|nr:hypothetical protein [Bacillus cereus]PFQ75691.1 hypothetical protein COK15_15140 [Bacillus cereus]TKH54249.1 hypothetical protein FC677_20230 [Bacillus cereus]WIK98175.1 hypothetical protein QPL86_12020 [Bacillus bombysepticus]
MARSQLLKDLVSGQVSIENILLRLKVILSDLDNDLIMSWIQGELHGYESGEELPAYRILKGSPVGTYLINGHAKYSNAQVPIEAVLGKEMIEQLITVNVKDSIKTLEEILNSESKEKYGKVVPTTICHGISNDDLQIIGMTIKCASNLISGIVSKVKSKLVDIIMELEKQYDNLDEMDIKSQVDEDNSKKEQVILNIEQIIFDESIKLGDKNKLSRSGIGHWFGWGK